MCIRDRAEQVHLVDGQAAQALREHLPAHHHVPAHAEDAHLDQDGDQDIVMSGFVRYFGDNGEEKDVATMLYAKNTGSATVPHFQGWYQNTNGIAAFLNKAAYFITGDLDLDDDVDLFTLWQDSLDEDVLYVGGIILSLIHI